METIQLNNVLLHKTDCFTFLKSLADNSVDLIATDPPYFKVVAQGWDKQWQTKADFLTWLDKVLIELARVLKPNGSMYLFAGPHSATQVENLIAKHFNMLNHIVWRKQSGRHLGCCKEELRRFFPQTEHILFATSKKPVPFSFEPIRRYLLNAIKKAGITQKQVDKACGCQMSGHWFGKSQWSLPSEKHYNTINKLVNNRLKPYQQIYQSYHDILKLSNSARRTFNVTKQVPFTDVWDFKTVNYYQGKHPCEKPIELMNHIISTSSLPGDVVLDCFTGSGSTAIACINTNRQFIGCELGDDEFTMASNRLNPT